MDFRYTPTEEAFRAKLHSWLEKTSAEIFGRGKDGRRPPVSPTPATTRDGIDSANTIDDSTIPATSRCTGRKSMAAAAPR